MTVENNDVIVLGHIGLKATEKAVCTCDFSQA